MKEVVVPFSVEPTATNHFAWARTLMGLQRTHMAAVRTSVSLIAFGFTVAKFFILLEIGLERGLLSAPRAGGGMGALGAHPHEPRNMGLLLIATGIVSLAVFTLQYSRAIAYLRSSAFEAIAGYGRKVMTMPVYMISITVMLIGVAAFVSVLRQL